MSTASIVGGGPAGLIAAEVLARAGVAVTVYEHTNAFCRKFLLAGRGGLNITHSEPLARMLTRYGTSADRLAPMLTAFDAAALRHWCAGLGQETFVGSSGRVFPVAFRATPLVRAWLARLDELGVRIETRRRWTAWTDQPGELRFAGSDGVETTTRSDVAVFALGGASWPRLGSDGGWVEAFREHGVRVAPLRAANVGVEASWSEVFADRFAGTPLKNVAVTVRGQHGIVGRGDAMITRHGIEGGPVYAIGAAVRDALDGPPPCVLEVDLRPDLSIEHLTDRLARRRPKDSTSTWLRRTVGLDPVGAALLREASGGAITQEPAAAAALIKAVPVTVTTTRPIDRAISTAGGVAWSDVDDALMLHARPGTFVAGEMLDWEAPTGGYLLQASFSTGVAAARGALAWLAQHDAS